MGSQCRVAVSRCILRVTTAVTFVVTVAVAGECGRRWWLVEERKRNDCFTGFYLIIYDSNSKKRSRVAFWCGG